MQEKISDVSTFITDVLPKHKEIILKTATHLHCKIIQNKENEGKEYLKIYLKKLKCTLGHSQQISNMFTYRLQTSGGSNIFR